VAFDQVVSELQLFKVGSQFSLLSVLFIPVSANACFQSTKLGNRALMIKDEV
jgi:hypothetical protein